MEPLSQTRVLSLRDATQVAVARRAATELAESVGLNEQRIGALNIVVAELANNLLQHAGGGQLLLQYIEGLGVIDVMAVDHGPGIADVARCLKDGYSTGSTPGLGLGAVYRFARRFGAYSVLGRTTVVAARMEEMKSTSGSPNMSVVSTAIDGEVLSGDGWAVSEDGGTFLVVDGLGHGVLASEAARTAMETFRSHQGFALPELIERLHAALRPTRGAAAAVARVDTGKLHFAGIGNISCTLHAGGRTQSCVSHNGTLGHQMRRVQVFDYSCAPGTVMVMHSDGLTANVRTPIPSSLLDEQPIVIAPFLYAEQLRGRDDATVLVARLEGGALE